MDNKELIIKLYFEDGHTATYIAEKLKISNAYITKIIKLDSRYYEEKERRKEISIKKHNAKKAESVIRKRKQQQNDYAILKNQHIQATLELSGGSRPISNRAFRDWNSSIYRFNEKSKSYVLRKGIIVGADVPKKINWKNF